MKITWNEGAEKPKYESGLPEEIHFWKNEGGLFILRFAGDPICARWYAWHSGVAIKDVGLDG